MENKMISKEEYRKTQYYKESIKLIKNFINEFLEGDINRLKTFCFDNLKRKKKYRRPSIINGQWNFDCDDTDLARAIYCVVWGHIFDLKANEIGAWNSDRIPYRGDTMNSFNTVFGKCLYRAKFYGLENNTKILEFREKYHTIGNFILIANNENVNRRRGSFWDLKDYFDLFLIEIYNYQNNKECRMEKEFDENPFYKEFSITSMKEAFFLEDYFDGEIPKEFINISQADRKKMTRSKEDRIDIQKSKKKVDYFTEDEYKKLVNEYITKSEIVIANRADKIITALQEELKESENIGIFQDGK